jgi:hypothetical protein
MALSLLEEVTTLVYISEYSILFIYILYNLFTSLPLRNKHATFRLYCYLSILLCTLRCLVNLLFYLELGRLPQFFIYIVIHAVSYTSLLIIATYWYSIIRQCKCTQYDFSLPSHTRKKYFTRIQRIFYTLILLFYLHGLSIIILFLLNFYTIPSFKEACLQITYIFLGKLTSCIYLFISAIMLLRRIRNYTSLNPSKLVRNIYIIQVILILLVPYCGMIWLYFMRDDRFQVLM